MDELEKKTNATILGIVYHPWLRGIPEDVKEDIEEMVRTLSNSLIKPGHCRVVKKECLIGAYGNEPKFKADLDEILAAIDKRLDLIEGFTR